MDRRSKVILGIFIAVLIGIIVIEIVRPKPLNWDPSYTSHHTIPYGCYVLFTELPVLFPGSAVHSKAETPYAVLTARDSLQSHNYLFVNSTLNFDQQETAELLRFVHQGNNAFMAASYFGEYLSDTLQIRVQSEFALAPDSVRISLTNQQFSDNKTTLHRGNTKGRFTALDTLHTIVLGYIQWADESGKDGTDQRKAPNFIQVSYGKGHFYMHSNPETFTNFYLLNGNADYVSHAMSYLDDRPMLWDDYLKVGRVVVDSPMRFVLGQAALKWAYYLCISGLIIFLVFRAKREQRMIPVIRPLENSSVEFARTIGNLYFQHRDYADLIAKKSNYFMEYIRSRYYLDTHAIHENLIRDLALKSGKSVKETKEIVDYIRYLRNKDTHSEMELAQLNQKIISFKN